MKELNINLRACDGVPNPVRMNNTHMWVMTAFLTVLVVIGSVLYSYHVLLMAVVGLITSLVVEYVFTKVRKRSFSINGVFITPLVFVLLMPPLLPLYMVVVGVTFAVFFGKMVFGGLGRNIFNPALVGYLFLLVTFPVALESEFVMPLTLEAVSITNISDLSFVGNAENIFRLLLGLEANTIGSTFMLGIWLLGVVAMFFKIVDYKIPVTILIGIVLFTLFLGHYYPDLYHDPFTSIFIGQVMFISFFVATDPVTAPFTSRGKILYGLGIALLTVVIRGLATAPEGIVYAVIIMNAVGPMLESGEEHE